MAEGTKVLVTKLNNNNYQLWKFKMELLLLKEDQWHVIQNQKPDNVAEAEWKKLDGKARATIGLLIEDNQVTHIRNTKTAKEAWEALKAYHEKATLTSKVFILKKLCRMNLSEDGNVETHIESMMDLVQELTSLGEELKDHLVVAFLLCSLPDSYSPLVSALEGRPESDLTLEMVKGKLIQEYRRRTESKEGLDEMIGKRC